MSADVAPSRRLKCPRDLQTAQPSSRGGSATEGPHPRPLTTQDTLPNHRPLGRSLNPKVFWVRDDGESQATGLAGGSICCILVIRSRSSLLAVLEGSHRRHLTRRRLPHELVLASDRNARVC